MNRSNSVLRNPLLSLALTAVGVLATGCVDSAESTTDTVEHVVVNQHGALPVAPLGEIRVVGDQVSLASPGWTETAPGMWTRSSAGDATSIGLLREDNSA